MCKITERIDCEKEGMGMIEMLHKGSDILPISEGTTKKYKDTAL
jgi:hypothetical protein